MTEFLPYVENPTFDPTIPPVIAVVGDVHYDVSTWAIPTVAVVTEGPECSGPYGCGKRHANAASVTAHQEEGRAGREQAEADYRHDRYCERAWESRYDTYAGPEEEARDRWLDGFRES